MSLKSMLLLSATTLMFTVTGCAPKSVEYTLPTNTVEYSTPRVVEYHVPETIMREVRNIEIINGITTKKQVYKLLGQPTHLTNSEDITGQPEDYAVYETDEKGFDISLNYLDKDGITYSYDYKQDTKKSSLGITFDKNNVVKGLLH